MFFEVKAKAHYRFDIKKKDGNHLIFGTGQRKKETNI